MERTIWWSPKTTKKETYTFLSGEVLFSFLLDDFLRGDLDFFVSLGVFLSGDFGGFSLSFTDVLALSFRFGVFLSGDLDFSFTLAAFLSGDLVSSLSLESSLSGDSSSSDSFLFFGGLPRFCVKTFGGLPRFFAGVWSANSFSAAAVDEPFPFLLELLACSCRCMAAFTSLN